MPTTQVALEQTWTATAQGTHPPYWTPGATPTLGTPPFLDPFGTPTPSRTPGVNLECPDEPFIIDGLEYEWAMVCGACIAEMRGTATPIFGVPVQPFPTMNLNTFTPVPTGTAPPIMTWTPTWTPTPTATAPTPTPTGVWGYYARQNFDELDEIPYTLSGRNPGIFAGRTGDGAGSFPGQSDGGYRWYIEVRLEPDPTKTIAGVGIDFMRNIPNGGSPGAVVGVIYYRDGVSFAAQALASNYFSTTPNVWYSATHGHPASGSLNYTDVDEVRFYYTGHVPTSGGGLYFDNAWIFYHGDTDPTPTPTATSTPTPTYTPTVPGVPTATPQWWATGFPVMPGLSVDCSVPRYIDLERPLIDWNLGPTERDPVCLTILPYLNIGFDLINNTAGEVFGFFIPPIEFQQVNVCFVGITVVLNIVGFQLDMSILLGVPLLAYLLRWVLFQ